MKRSGPPRRKSRLSRRSAKRAAEDAAWACVREIVRRRDGERCRLVSTECWGPLDPHHVWPTGRGGPRLDPENVILLCRGHHRWAHNNPTMAKEAGVLA